MALATITTNPASQTVVVGGQVTFSVVATLPAGTPGGMNYQWQRAGADIAGATAATYTTPPATLADNGVQFRCRVTNAGDTADTNVAVLSVNPAIATPPVWPNGVNHVISAVNPPTLTGETVRESRIKFWFVAFAFVALVGFAIIFTWMAMRDNGHAVPAPQPPVRFVSCQQACEQRAVQSGLDPAGAKLACQITCGTAPAPTNPGPAQGGTTNPPLAPTPPAPAPASASAPQPAQPPVLILNQPQIGADLSCDLKSCVSSCKRQTQDTAVANRCEDACRTLGCR